MQHKTTEELITKIIACTALGLAGFSQAGCDISTLKKQKLLNQYDAGMHRGAPGNYQNEPNGFIRPGQGAPDLRGGLLGHAQNARPAAPSAGFIILSNVEHLKFVLLVTFN
jgi:hypothetical protein